MIAPIGANVDPFGHNGCSRSCCARAGMDCVRLYAPGPARDAAPRPALLVDVARRLARPRRTASPTSTARRGDDLGYHLDKSLAQMPPDLPRADGLLRRRQPRRRPDARRTSTASAGWTRWTGAATRAPARRARSSTAPPRNGEHPGRAPATSSITRRLLLRALGHQALEPAGREPARARGEVGRRGRRGRGPAVPARRADRGLEARSSSTSSTTRSPARRSSPPTRTPRPVRRGRSIASASFNRRSSRSAADRHPAPRRTRRRSSSSTPTPGRCGPTSSSSSRGFRNERERMPDDEGAAVAVQRTRSADDAERPARPHRLPRRAAAARLPALPDRTGRRGRRVRRDGDGDDARERVPRARGRSGNGVAVSPRGPGDRGEARAGRRRPRGRRRRPVGHVGPLGARLRRGRRRFECTRCGSWSRARCAASCASRAATETPRSSRTSSSAPAPATSRCGSCSTGARRSELLKLRFPTALTTDHATFEVPYGHIERPAAGDEEPAQAWVDVSGEVDGAPAGSRSSTTASTASTFRAGTSA